MLMIQMDTNLILVFIRIIRKISILVSSRYRSHALVYLYHNCISINTT